MALFHACGAAPQMRFRAMSRDTDVFSRATETNHFSDKKDYVTTLSMNYHSDNICTEKRKNVKTHLSSAL